MTNAQYIKGGKSLLQMIACDQGVREDEGLVGATMTEPVAASYNSSSDWHLDRPPGLPIPPWKQISQGGNHDVQELFQESAAEYEGDSGVWTPSVTTHEGISHIAMRMLA